MSNDKDLIIDKEYFQDLQRKKKEERVLDNKILNSIEKNQSIVKQNKDIFRENETKFSTCSLYNPCPICHKCQNKASHLYVRCQTCQIPICTHTYKDRQYLIRRNNFSIEVSDEVKEELKMLSEIYK